MPTNELFTTLAGGFKDTCLELVKSTQELPQKARLFLQETNRALLMLKVPCVYFNNTDYVRQAKEEVQQI